MSTLLLLIFDIQTNGGIKMITWKEYLIMQFLNTITFLLIQEFFWLKIRKRFDGIVGGSKEALTKTQFEKIRQRMREWRQRQKEALIQAHRK